jgi:hypothetical protein
MRSLFASFLTGLCMLLLFSCGGKKGTNWSFEPDRNSKEPYGCHIAYAELSAMFPAARVQPASRFMLRVNELLEEGPSSPQLLIVVCRDFMIDSLETTRLMELVSLGHHVLVLAEDAGTEWRNLFGVKDIQSEWSADTLSHKFMLEPDDSLQSFSYSGLNSCTWFTDTDTLPDTLSHWGWFVRSDTLQPNLRALWHGNGLLAWGCAPVVFTNHFMLQRENRRYYEILLNAMEPQGLGGIHWTSKPYILPGEGDSSAWSELWNRPLLFGAFLLMLLLLGLYALLAARREQRAIPVVPVPVDASLEFVRTVGRLYFLQKRPDRLAEKMMNHYAAYLHRNYGFTLDEGWLPLHARLAARTGHGTDETKAFLGWLDYLRQGGQISEQELLHLYHQLRKFR